MVFWYIIVYHCRGDVQRRKYIQRSRDHCGRWVYQWQLWRGRGSWWGVDWGRAWGEKVERILESVLICKSMLASIAIEIMSDSFLLIRFFVYWRELQTYLLPCDLCNAGLFLFRGGHIHQSIHLLLSISALSLIQFIRWYISRVGEYFIAPYIMILVS